MTNEISGNEPSNATPNAPPTPATPTFWKRRSTLIGGVVLALGLTGAIAAKAFDPPFGPHMGHGFGPGFGPGMMMRGGDLTPEQIEQFADRGVRHMAVEIDATNEQQEKLRAIAKALVKDLVPLHDARQQAAERARTLLSQSTVDKAEIEKFRAEQIAKADAASKRIAQAVTDAADVLTPEQRRKLVDRMPRPGAGPFWHRG